MTLKVAPTPTVYNATAATFNTINGAKVATVALGNVRGVIGSVIADTAIPIASAISKYLITGIYVTNSNAALGSLLTAGMYTASAQGGAKLVVSTTTYSVLTSTSVLLQQVLVGASAETFTSGNIWFNVNGASSIPATFDIYVEGVDLT